jgi:hypothetical protein
MRKSTVPLFDRMKHGIDITPLFTVLWYSILNLKRHTGQRLCSYIATLEIPSFIFKILNFPMTNV